MYDFVAVGDIVTDVFIRLKDASVHCDIDKEYCTISMPFGDKIPYESVEVIRAVGNSANAAVSASRLGLRSVLVSDIGDDQNGEECVESLKKDGVNADLLAMHPGHQTNCHYVLWYESDRTILVKHEAYERHLPDIGKSKWLYLSSLGSDSLRYHEEIIEYVKNNPGINLAFQPGTFQIKLGRETLKELYQNCKIFFSNIDEAERILEIVGSEPETLLEKISVLGPKIVVLTDGPKGAYAYDGTNKFFVPPYPDPKDPFERTGAGDAFASTTVAALALGKTLEEALLWGSVNSMSVVQQVGAQKGLLIREEIEKYLVSAPKEFKISKLK